MNNLLEEKRELDKKIEEFTTKAKTVCQDKNTPLEERWELFCEGDLGNEDSYYFDFDKIDVYNELNREYYKYETVYLVDLVSELDILVKQPIEEVNSWEEETREKIDELGGVEFVDSMKEQLIQGWTKSCQYDW